MKTPEEIKKGLAACSADECHGQHVGCTYQDQFFCTMRMCGDALAYIKQLEMAKAERDAINKDRIDLAIRLAQAERERDEAIEALDNIRHCDCCKHYAKNGGEEPCWSCDMLRKTNYEWRGVCEDNSK